MQIIANIYVKNDAKNQIFLMNCCFWGINFDKKAIEAVFLTKIEIKILQY
jgi:hypothetical protein